MEFYRVIVQRALEFDRVKFVFASDDMGYKTGLMISPADTRALVLPCHRQLAAGSHAVGRPYLLHSCGNLSEIMDEIIDDLKYDGKHSYEDAIQPVEEAYDCWSQRIAILGGIDLDFICRSTPEAVHQRSLGMLERSAKRGSYALGTGNSVPEYIAQDKYFAMISAATDGRQ